MKTKSKEKSSCLIDMKLKKLKILHIKCKMKWANTEISVQYVPSFDWLKINS